MLLQLYPQVHRRHSSLPVFGPIIEDFGAWLLNEGCSTDCIREHFCCMRRKARLLHKRGVRSVGELTKAKLRACGPAQRLDDRRLAASVRLMERYFASETSFFGTQPRSRLAHRVQISPSGSTKVANCHSIPIDQPRPPQTPAASFKSPYRKRFGAHLFAPAFARRGVSDQG